MPRRPFQSSSLLTSVERVWAQLRKYYHHDLPPAVFTLGKGIQKSGNIHAGHWAPSRWEEDESPRHEVFIGAEALKNGSDEVLNTILHEAAHALAFARSIQDTSREGRYHNGRFRKLALEVGLEVQQHPTQGWANTKLSRTARKRYADQLTDLNRAITGYRRIIHREIRKTRIAMLCSCEPARTIYIAPGVAKKGAILCGVCEQMFRIKLPEDDSLLK